MDDSPTRRRRRIPAGGARPATLLLLLAAACGPSSEPETPAADPAVPEAPEAAAPERPEPEPLEPVEGQRAGLRSLSLKLQSATLLPDRLELLVVFENTSDSSFGLAGDLGAGDFRLVEDGGEELAPVDFEPGLERVDSGTGLAPGKLNGGAVSFPRPIGDAFELRVPGFAPLAFGWEHVRVGTQQDDQAPIFDEEGLPDPPVEELPLVRRSDPLDDLDPVLAEQAAAIESYDVDRYLATFAAERRDEERHIFHRLRPLALTDVEMRAERLLAEGGDQRRARVELSFGFDGLPDDNRFFHTLDAGFARSREGWRVASLTDVAGPAGGRRVPWRHGDIAVHRSHHFLIVTGPRLRSQLVELAGDAEAAYAALYHRGLPLAPGYVVYFVPTLAEFERVAGHPRALGAALARYSSDGETTRVDSRAFYVNGPLFTGAAGGYFPAEARRVTVTHELVHLALAEDSRPATPPWLKEGTAVYFSGDLSFDVSRALVRRGLGRLDLERMTREPLGRHDTVGRQAADEYLFAGKTVAWLIEEHGQEPFLDFYRAFAERPLGEVSTSAAIAALTRPADLSELLAGPRGAFAVELADQTLGRHFGLRLGELEAAVKDRLRVLHG